MRLDRIVLTISLVLLLFLVAWRGGVWPLWAIATSGTIGFLVVTGGRPKLPPSTTPIRPAVLIPTHNNIGTIGDVTTRSLSFGLPVYVVDDGSSDGSGPAARDAGALLLTHERNRGKGQALLTGMRQAQQDGFTHVICLDADAQHDPADIPRFVEAIQQQFDAIIVGVRDLSTAPKSSQFGRRFSNFWIWFETGQSVGDSQCGFRAYPIAPVLALKLGGRRYDLEIEVLTRCLWAGISVIDIPCFVYYPDPTERVSSFDPFRDNLRISWMNTRLVVEKLLNPHLWLPFRPRTTQWAGATRGAEYGWRLVFFLLNRFGRKPAYMVVSFLSFWYLIVASDARHFVGNFLNRVEPGTGDWPRIYRVFRNFSHAIVDRFLWLQRGPSEFRYTHDGVEALQQAFEHSRGAVIIGAHLGNLEVNAGSHEASSRVHRLRIVRFVGKNDPGIALLNAISSPWKPGFIAVNQENGFAALSIIRELRAGAVIAMHGDRMIDGRSTSVEFLGGEALFPSGPWLVAALAQVPVFVVGCFKTGSDSYHVIVEPPRELKFDRLKSREECLHQWVSEYAATLEKWARQYPEQWYNFHNFWSEPPAPH